jgi:hypothetical protein
MGPIAFPLDGVTAVLVYLSKSAQSNVIAVFENIALPESGDPSINETNVGKDTFMETDKRDSKTIKRFLVTPGLDYQTFVGTRQAAGSETDRELERRRSLRSRRMLKLSRIQSKSAPKLDIYQQFVPKSQQRAVDRLEEVPGKRHP